ncbi:MAG: MarR family transcriptional regulator [Actinobacteria bacterium]|nr:MarR family transcriptional regulator [Actinomycetota bacterium]
MNESATAERLVEVLTAAQAALDTRISQSLSGALGISYGEYRLLAALASAPNRQASRVDLAAAVGLTPSGVTRALKPLEKIGMVASVKHDRDARLTLASLTRSGVRTVANGAEIVADRLAVTMEHAPQTAANIASLTAMLEELAAA